MPAEVRTTGRRERNKQQKLERITAAARELFGEHGVDVVTTQQIADRADVGAGTLFLYAKTKAELLLLVHNVKLTEAIETGLAAAEETTGPLDAVMEIIRPIVVCNREQIENGRTYLRELVFGDPNEPHHAQGLELTRRVDRAMAEILQRTGSTDEQDADQLARIISSIMFISMTATIYAPLSDDEVLRDIREQVGVLLGVSRTRQP
jgi:TetR/AcrR family transcriptional regulator